MQLHIASLKTMKNDVAIHPSSNHIEYETHILLDAYIPVNLRMKFLTSKYLAIGFSDSIKIQNRLNLISIRPIFKEEVLVMPISFERTRDYLHCGKSLFIIAI
jgi:hypothetical protein